MHEKLRQLIDDTSKKFDLSNFYLKRHQFFKENNYQNNVTYILNMEWFPKDAEEQADEYNPSGAISIDLDFHTKQLKNVIFVNGINLLDGELPTSNNIEEAIEWIEEESGLEFGRQFKLESSDSHHLRFLAAADNLPVFPSGQIELQFNEDGKLSLYSMHGNFPEAEKVNWEPFALTEADTKEIIKKQCTLLEIPIVEEEKWQKVYAISSCFITNDGKQVLSYEDVEADRSHIKLDKLVEWSEPEVRAFPTEDIDQSTETTLEAAISNKELPLTPLTEEEIETGVSMTTAYLASTFPEDSGKWKITSLRQQGNYILASIKANEKRSRVLTRKLTVVLRKEDFTPINHMDNQLLLDSFANFTEATPETITGEEAFATLYQYVKVTPVYVYDQASDQYILCGKVDSALAIDATSGELIELEALN